jgi:hypothetical protein
MAENTDIGTWESWLEAGRWMLPSGWLEREVINANAAARKLGYQPLEIVYVKERTSFMNRTILFKLRGQAIVLTAFQNAIRRIAEAA